MKRFQDAVALVFIFSVLVLTVISVLGVWSMVGQEVIRKSLETGGLLAIVALVVVGARKYVGSSLATDVSVSQVPSPIFPVLRNATLAIFIIASTLAAFVGVMSIWGMIVDREMLYKAVASLVVMSFGASVVTVTCLQREGGQLLKRHPVLVVTLIILLILYWVGSVIS